MYGPSKNFDERLNDIERKHTAMARGYITEIRNDGLIVLKPYACRCGFSIPVAGIVMLLACLLFFSAFIWQLFGQTFRTNALPSWIRAPFLNKAAHGPCKSIRQQSIVRP